MSRIILTASLIVLINVLVGCNGAESGKSQLLSKEARAEAKIDVGFAAAAEIDIVEQVAINRKAYREGLDMLVSYYTKTGNNMKLQWAQKELVSLDMIQQYNYVIEAGVAGPHLKADVAIGEASDLYLEASKLEKQASVLIFKDDNLLRLALSKYNQLISKYPSSDKISEAAYRAALIYTHFKDYAIAVVYYKRTYQWDPETEHPAKYKAAYMLDRQLHRRDEALNLYIQAVEEGKLAENYREFAKIRIAYLTRGDKTEE